MQVSKGSDTTSSFTLNDFANFPSPTATFQPVEILNGLLILDDPSLNIGLATGGTDFQLPNLDNSEASSGSGGLEVRQGSVNITGANTGMVLDGSFILSGGDADFADGTNNNFIQYSVSGDAGITISDAASELRVGTQIRRSTLSTSGILNLEMTAGNLYIGEGSGGESTRGVLEILNSGSSFTHTGGTITLLDDNNFGSTPTIASLLLEPTSSDLSGSTIVVDLTGNEQDFTINSNVPLNDLTLQSTSGSDSELVGVNTRALTVGGDLSVQDDIELQSNNLDLTLEGDFTLTGTAAYTPGSNTTSFNVAASTTNTLSGAVSPSFNNFSKSGSGTLQLGSDISITGATFNLSAGTLDDNGNTINFSGQQMTIDGTHASPSNSTSNGIIFNASSQQILQTNDSGTFGNLIIDNSGGVALPDVKQDFRVNNTLALDEGVLDIGPALLVLGTSAEIVGDAASEGSYGSEFSNFSDANQIQTNSSIIDFGVEKEFSSGTTSDFTFPVGEATRYTPVEISFSTATSGTSGSAGGSVRVRPRNAVAPIMLSEPQAVQDAILQYYWLINASDLAGFEADMIFNYDDEVIGTDAESTYEGALAFFSNPDNEVSDGVGTVNTTANTITIPLDMPISSPADSLTDDNDFSGEYFAGNPSTIPDAFTALLFDNNAGNGNVNDPTNYCFDSDSDGDCSGEVRATDFNNQVVGGLINIDDSQTLSLNVSNVSFSRTTIPSSAILEVQSGTSNHNLGRVSGSGTIRVLSNTTDAALPAGDYADFFTDCLSGGGGLEYGGTGNYTILNEANEVKSLTLFGSGTKTMVANNINICEDFSISAGSVTFADGNTVTVNRDFILTSGTVNLGQNGTVEIINDLSLTGGTINGATGADISLEGDVTRASTAISLDDATLVLAGSSPQNFAGTFTGGNALGSLTINNDAGASLGDDVEIGGTLTLTDGIIYTSTPSLADPISTAGAELILGNLATTTGASDTSYVEGLMSRSSLGTTGNVTFPVGDGGYLAQVTVSNPTVVTDWNVYYVYGDPQAISNNFSSAIDGTISDDEYWVVDGSGSANIGLTYGIQSGVTNPSGLSIVRLEDDNSSGTFTSADQWTEVDINNSSTDPEVGTLTTTAKQNFSTSMFTLGEQKEGALPVELTEFGAGMVDRAIVVRWRTATETENYGFEIQRRFIAQSEHSGRADTTQWQEVAFVKGQGTVTEPHNYHYADHSVSEAGSYEYRLKQVDYNGQHALYDPVSVRFEAPEQFKLYQNYPNPFNPTTTIELDVAEEARLNLVVYNVLGQKVATLLDNEYREAGRYNFQFNGSHLASGMYIMVLRANGQQFTRKMTLIK